jgi:hypothetical protein
MIDTNLVLIIGGILILFIIGLIMVTGNNASLPTASGTHSSNTVDVSRLLSEPADQLPLCKTITTSNITGLKFYTYNDKTRQITGKLNAYNNSVSITGKGAILVTNMTGKFINKVKLTIKASEMPADNIWIFDSKGTHKALALNLGHDMPFNCNLHHGESFVISIPAVAHDNKITITIDSILV